MIGFALGNALGPQFWLDKYKPSNRIPWALTLMAALVSIFSTVALEFLFSRENKRRDALKAQALRSGVGLSAFDEYAFVESRDDEGKTTRRKVDKMYLDLTDGENLAFRYVL